MSPKTMASDGHVAWQAVWISPSRTGRSCFSASILAELMRYVAENDGLRRASGLAGGLDFAVAHRAVLLLGVDLGRVDALCRRKRWPPTGKWPGRRFGFRRRAPGGPASRRRSWPS